MEGYSYGKTNRMVPPSQSQAGQVGRAGAPRKGIADAGQEGSVIMTKRYYIVDRHTPPTYEQIATVQTCPICKLPVEMAEQTWCKVATYIWDTDVKIAHDYCIRRERGES